MQRSKFMSKFWNFFLKILDDSVESVSVVNNGGNPQIVVTPKGTAKDILEAVNKNGKKTTQEEGK